MDLIENILAKKGPLLSNELAAELAKRANISTSTARQRVSRSSGRIKKLKGIPFPRNARFVYLERDFGSSRYWERLAEALIATNSALGYAIAGLRQFDGVVPVHFFKIICGSPVRQLKHLSPEMVLTRLSEAGLVKTVSVPGIGNCVALTQEEEYYHWQEAKIQARLITERILLSAMRDWLRKLGIASYELVATRDSDPLPKVGTFVWDLSAPSYLGHMVRSSADGKPKPGFVVCDVNLTKPMTVTGVAPFIRKCLTLRALKNVGPCMQFLIANRFEKDAFRKLRQHGIIAATPATLFGEEIANALSELTSVLANAANAAFDAEKFQVLFSALGRIEGASNQLRGTLFEFIAARAAKLKGLGDIHMNHVFTAPDTQKAEVDVLAVRYKHSIVAIECKGYSPRATIPDADFKRWLQHNVPTSYKAIRNHPDYKNLPVTFEFWTTAPITSESLALYNNAKSTIKKSRYEIALRSPADVMQICQDTREESLITAFEKHFTLEDRSSPPIVREIKTPMIVDDSVLDDFWQ